MYMMSQSISNHPTGLFYYCTYYTRYVKFQTITFSLCLYFQKRSVSPFYVLYTTVYCFLSFASSVTSR